MAWRQISRPGEGGTFPFQPDDGLGKGRGNADPDFQMPVIQVKMNGGLDIGVVGHADFLDGIPKLAPGPGFAGLQKRKIRLVVGIDAGH